MSLRMYTEQIFVYHLKFFICISFSSSDKSVNQLSKMGDFKSSSVEIDPLVWCFERSLVIFLRMFTITWEHFMNVIHDGLVVYTYVLGCSSFQHQAVAVRFKVFNKLLCCWCLAWIFMLVFTFLNWENLNRC